MNVRIHHEETPEGRLAAVAVSLMYHMETSKQRLPDYADFREAMRPFIKRELLNARLDEANMSLKVALADRIKDIASELKALKFPHSMESL